MLVEQARQFHPGKTEMNKPFFPLTLCWPDIVVCRSQSGDRGCSGCEVKAGDLQLMWCIVPAADTTPLQSCADYWECYPSRLMCIYSHKTHAKLKVCVWEDTCTWIIKGILLLQQMTWDLLNIWRWSVQIPKSFWALLCPITSVCFSSWITPGHSPAALNIICRLSGITTCKVQVRLQGMLLPF